MSEPSSETLPSAKRRKSPAEAAKALLARARYLTDDADRLFRHNGAFWEEVSDAAARQLARDCDLGKSTASRRREFVDELRAISYLAGLKWGRAKDWEMPFKNGVVDVRSGEIRDHNPDDYLERVLPWNYDPAAQAPTWDQALCDWFGEMAGEEGGPICALQEFFGYACLSHARYKKALLVLGPSDSGKSLIPFVLALMVGRDQTCSLPLEHMDDPQARAVIVGKALNLLTEITTSALIADGGFKTLVSTEEPVLINAKYRPPFSYYPTAKHCFVTNNLPGLSDRTEGVLNRLLVIPMMRVFAKDEQDDQLPAKLELEIPGILAWSARGAKRLISQNGKFSDVAAGVAVVDELRRRANPAIDFIAEMLKPSETAAVPLAKLVGLFNHYKGGQRVTARGLGAMLRSAGKTVKLVKRGRIVARSLLGYEIVHDKLPSMFMVPPDAAASDAAEIDATDAVELSTPPSGDDHGPG